MKSACNRASRTERPRVPLWFVQPARKTVRFALSAAQDGCRRASGAIVRPGQPRIIAFKAKLQTPAEPKTTRGRSSCCPGPEREVADAQHDRGRHHRRRVVQARMMAGSHWLKVDRRCAKPRAPRRGHRRTRDRAGRRGTRAEGRQPHQGARREPKRWRRGRTSPVARRDWIHWITSGKKAETRASASTWRDKLACGHAACCSIARACNRATWARRKPWSDGRRAGS